MPSKSAASAGVQGCAFCSVFVSVLGYQFLLVSVPAIGLKSYNVCTLRSVRSSRAGGAPTFTPTRYPSASRAPLCQSPSTGRPCHSTRSLTAIGCHCLHVGIYTVILRSLLSFSVKMTVSPRATVAAMLLGAVRTAQVEHCPARKPQKRVVKRPPTPNRPAIGRRCAIEIDNAKGT